MNIKIGQRVIMLHQYRSQISKGDTDYLANCAQAVLRERMQFSNPALSSYLLDEKIGKVNHPIP